MPRITPITTKSELPAEHHAAADAFEVAAPPDGDKFPG
jgi:hypothetical protein